MKCISVWQPWATYLALGIKCYETRHWLTQYRGPMAIHASQRKDAEGRELFDQFMSWILRDELSRVGTACINAGYKQFDDLPFGAIVAVGELAGVYSTNDQNLVVSRTENMLGNYDEDRFAWHFTDMRRLAKPIEFSGRQGIFILPGYITQTIQEQLAA